MFDAKSILEALVNGAGGSAMGQRPSSPGGGALGGGLGDLIGGMLGGQQAGGGGRGVPSQQGGGLEDLLRNMLPGGPASGQPGHEEPAKRGALDDLLRNMVQGSGGGGQGSAGHGAGGQGAGGGLGDILGKLQEQLGNAGRSGQSGGAGGQSITDILGDLLGQATAGAKEGAGRIGESTGAREALERMSGGRSPDELMNQLKELIANNKMGAGAILGGLGALVLGSRTGRSIAVNAAKLGALALIGGLAYRAYQNYSQGRTPVSDPNFVPDQAPAGSGFEPEATTNEQATLYVRAMIAAAAADGRIDAVEQQRIIGSLSGSGLGQAAEEFLANELNQPADARTLAAAVDGPAEAVKVYTAARMAIDPDTHGEARFLSELAERLGIDMNLKAHIDTTAQSAAA